MPKLTPEQEKMLEAVLKSRSGKPETTARFLSSSLYLAGADDPARSLADRLKIPPENRLRWSDPSKDFSYYAREEHSLFFGEIKGDFQVAADVGLFHVDWPWLDGELLALSREGLDIAVPDEESERPWDFILYRDGEKLAVEVEDDDETGEVRLIPLRSHEPSRDLP